MMQVTDKEKIENFVFSGENLYTKKKASDLVIMNFAMAAFSFLGAGLHDFGIWTFFFLAVPGGISLLFYARFDASKSLKDMRLYQFVGWLLLTVQVFLMMPFLLGLPENACTLSQIPFVYLYLLLVAVIVVTIQIALINRRIQSNFFETKTSWWIKNSLIGSSSWGGVTCIVFKWATKRYPEFFRDMDWFFAFFTIFFYAFLIQTTVFFYQYYLQIKYHIDEVLELK